MELFTEYGAIAGFWFDRVGGIYQFADILNIQEIYYMIHVIQPHTMAVYKIGAKGNEDCITG